MTTTIEHGPSAGGCTEAAKGGNTENSQVNIFGDSVNSDNFGAPIQQPKFVSGIGQKHTNEPGKEYKPYLTITFAEVQAMVDTPQSVAKEKARWFIPSTLLSRTHATQRENGEFGALWADLDKDPRPLDWVCNEVFTEIIGYCDLEVYASRSALEDYQKGRVLIPLVRPLSGGDWVLCQKVLNDKLAAYGMTPDRANQRTGQLCYLPNRGEFYTAHHQRNGAFFDPLVMWADEIEEARKAAPPPRPPRDNNHNTNGSVHDPVVDYLYEMGLVTDVLPSGALCVDCPEKAGHSSDNGPSETVWFPAGTDGYAQGHPKCMHESCKSTIKTRQDFLNAIGYSIYEFDVIDIPDSEYRRVKNDPVLPPPTPPETIDLATLFADLILTDEDVSKMADAEFLIDNLIVRSSLHAFIAPANGGKTTLFIHLCEELAARGSQIYYVNADANPPDLKRHQAHAKKHGYSVLAPDAKAGMGPKDIITRLKKINESANDLSDFLLILDTLKKFGSMIDKNSMKALLALLRGLSAKGATVCLLGHTNKRVEDDGNHIFEGTGDLRNDVDNLIYLESSKDETTKRQEITTRPDKVRAAFVPISYVIDFNKDREVSKCGSALPVLDSDARAVMVAAKAILQKRDCLAQTHLVKYIKEQIPDVGVKKITGCLRNLASGDGRIFDTKDGENNALIYLMRGRVTTEGFDDLSDQGNG